MEKFAPDYPYAAAPEPGQVTLIRPWLAWLRLPLPFQLNHVNCWRLGAPHSATVDLIDAGHGDQATMTEWRKILGDKRIDRLVVTHYHPDHLGAAGLLQQEFGGELFMTATEYRTAKITVEMSDADEMAARLQFFSNHGLSGETLNEQKQFDFGYAMSVPQFPHQYTEIGEEKITLGGQEWQTMVVAGHSDAQLILWCDAEKIFIAADQVLPAISPNVSVWFDYPEADPLGLYLASLERIRHTISNDYLVLPSHGRPFFGLHQRIDWLVAHHQERLDNLTEFIHEPTHTADCLATMFDRELDAFQINFAMGEALAHLNHLVTLNRAERIVTGSSVRFRAC